MALNAVQQVRLEIGDTDVALPILADVEIEYFLQKNNNSVRRASLDAAKTILFKLSMDSADETVGLLSIKGHRAAEAYKEALKMYIKNPDLNTVLQNAEVYAGGISRSDMQANVNDSDANFVQSPNQSPVVVPPRTFFEV